MDSVPVVPRGPWITRLGWLDEAVAREKIETPFEYRLLTKTYWLSDAINQGSGKLVALEEVYFNVGAEGIVTSYTLNVSLVNPVA